MNNNSIRAYIKRRVRWCLALAIVGWIAVAVTVPTVRDRRIEPFVTMLAFLIFGGAALALQRIKCPKCATRLGQVAMLIGAHWGSRKQLNFCPYCGTSLDAARETQQQQDAATNNPIR